MGRLTVRLYCCVLLLLRLPRVQGWLLLRVGAVPRLQLKLSVRHARCVVVRGVRSHFIFVGGTRDLFGEAQGISSMGAGHKEPLRRGHKMLLLDRATRALLGIGTTGLFVRSASSFPIGQSTTLYEARGTFLMGVQGVASVEAQGASAVVAQGAYSARAQGVSPVEAQGSSSSEARSASSVEAQATSSFKARRALLLRMAPGIQGTTLLED